ncbi:soluble lamin-associated protein of 75 kDa-like isoform X2 [Hippocampus zosterae]|uniref:soluble lamin-associated protein of 75 kDa-like isoform X2 n=1 Tax=Hippocampus zosterae TaxID=109293 RepID=UPI00223D16D1|nr:soluble lamin-associated protein of 75 kDa-like isoform X2 [Hippocampus zosterae]
MKFPVDFLANVSQAELEASAHNYLNNLLHSNTDSAEQLILSDSTKVSVGISRVGYVPLYGSSDKKRMLALFSPADPLTAVALYLLDQWWTVDDILKTCDLARDGVVEVETVGERIVLYVLNRVIYRVREMNSEEELPFLCHGEKDYAKICWSNGEAVGFYSVKPSGSLHNYLSTRRYQLPVMDSLFVRKCHRGNGFGLRMLEDFVLSFQDGRVGLRYPLTKAMYKMCEKYLCQYPGDTDLLWEVEGVGGPNQTFNISKRVQTIDLRAVSADLLLTAKPQEVTRETKKEVANEPIATKQTKEAKSMAYKVETLQEEVLVCSVSRDTSDKPVATQTTSSGQKQAKTADKIAEGHPKKVVRVEDIEAEAPEGGVSRKERTPPLSDLAVTEEIFSTRTEEKRKDYVGIAVEELVEVSTTLTPQEPEDAPALAAECRDTEAAIDTCGDSQMRIENVSEMEGFEEESQQEVTAGEELHITLDETFEGEEGYDEEQHESTVLPLRGTCKGALEEMNPCGQVKPDNMINETEVERPVEKLSSLEKSDALKAGKEEVTSMPEVNLEERQEEQEDDNSKGMAEAVTVSRDNAKDADHLTLDLNTVAVAVEKGKAGEDQNVASKTESSQKEGTQPPKLQKATVILVNFKTTHHLCVEKTTAPGERAGLQKEETVQAREEKDDSSPVGEEPKPEKPETDSEESRTRESIGQVFTTSYTETVKLKDENIDEMEEVPVIEIRVLRSGRKKVETSCKPTSRSKKHQAEDKCDIPGKESNRSRGIMMKEESTAVTKDTELGEQAATSETSVNMTKVITEMMTKMEDNLVSMMADSSDVVQAKNAVPPLAEETELTAAQHHSVEIVSKVQDLKAVEVVLDDGRAQDQRSAENGDENEEQTNKGTTAEKNVTNSPMGVETEQEDPGMEECTKGTQVQVIGHEGKAEETNAFIQDNQQICDQKGSLEEKDVDLQMETTELKTDIEKENTVLKDCVVEQEKVQQGQQGKCEASEPEVAARDTPEMASTSNDAAPESKTTQGAVEEHQQTQRAFVNIESGDSVQVKKVENVTTMVDQSTEATSSMEKKADLGQPEAERVPSQGKKSVSASKQRKSKRRHESEGEDEETAALEEMQIEQIGELQREAEDRAVSRGIAERHEEEDMTRREEYTEPKGQMEKEESKPHPEIREEGHTSIAEIDQTDERITVSVEKKVADPAIETRVLRKRKKSASITSLPRSKRVCTNSQIEMPKI